MEQGISEGDMILLRFKYMSFFDINPKVLFAVFRFRVLLLSLHTVNKTNKYKGLHI